MMKLALALAQRGLGRVWPNPSVGCVIVDREGHIAGRGWTQDGGRPHAETEALREAGLRARGATAYVTLEPCAHQGQTGPCAGALIDAGFARVVGAIEDPDPRVAGKGYAMLVQAGLIVATGVEARAAAALNAGFLSRIATGRPLVSAKIASTLDGKVALRGGESQWITGESARRHGHLLRAQHDAIVAGIGTVLADDPMLTCRLEGIERRRAPRVVLDTHARLPLTSRLVATASLQPVWLVCGVDAGKERLDLLKSHGVTVIQIPRIAHVPDILERLAAEGVTRLLVEGGPTVIGRFAEAQAIDRLYWYRAASMMGQGRDAASSLSVTKLSGMPRFVREETIRLGEDVLETYGRAA